MKWQKGPPNKPGWWLVETSTGDMAAWDVYWDRDESDDGKRGPRYLRFADDMNSSPVDREHRHFPVRRCFGPIPKPRKAKA